MLGQLIFKITVNKWKEHNSDHKPIYKKTLIANNFCTDSTLLSLPVSARWFYLGLILLCGDHNKDTVSVGEAYLKLIASNGVGHVKLLDQLESFQLVSYASFAQRKKEIKKVVEEEKKATEILGLDDEKTRHWFQGFVVEELNTMDTGLAMLSPKVDRAFGSEAGFREWLQGVTSAENFRRIEANEQLRYFRKALAAEMNFRGVS